MSAHTPGEWIVTNELKPRYCSQTGKRLEDQGCLSVCTSGFPSAHIAVVAPRNGEGVHNAAMMAASKRMFDLLLKIRAALNNDCVITMPIAQEIIAVTDKAEGRS